jgi:hypothetical protein
VARAAERVYVGRVPPRGAAVLQFRPCVAASVLAALVAALAAIPDLAIAGQASSAGTLTAVSGTSPFGSCTADGVAGQTGATNYAGSEVEPWIAVSPDGKLAGSFQQDRWSNGGARGLVAGVSADGGLNWQTTPITGITKCSGGGWDRASDPWLSFGPGGELYHASLVFDHDRLSSEVLVSQSADGGLTWGAPASITGDMSGEFNDKQSITADPARPGYVYAAWNRNTPATTSGYSTWFSRSTSAGGSWEQPREVHPNHILGLQVEALPDATGTLVLIGGLKQQSNRKYVALMRSGDQGQTWGPQVTVSRLMSAGVTDPDSSAKVRTGSNIPDVAVDRGSGASKGSLYAVWQDAGFNGRSRSRHDSIVIARSTDGGSTWSTPIKVNGTPTTVPVGNRQAFTPSVAVTSDGTVGVTYYDFRNNTPDAQTLPTDYWLVHCHPGPTTTCTNPADWTAGGEVRLTDSSFDMSDAPSASGYFVGDYEGLAAHGSDLLAFFSRVDGTDPASTSFRKVTP